MCDSKTARRNLLSHCLLVTCIGGMIALLPSSAQAWDGTNYNNLIQNPNFASGSGVPTNWTQWDGAGSRTITTASNIVSIAMPASINTNGGIYQTFATRSGHAYTLSGATQWVGTVNSGCSWYEIHLDPAGTAPSNGNDFGAGNIYSGGNGCAMTTQGAWKANPPSCSGGTTTTDKTYTATAATNTLLIKCGNCSGSTAWTLKVDASGAHPVSVIDAGALVGRVLSGCSGSTGLASATVTLSGAGAGTTTTDVNGYWEFDNLATGAYTITVSKSGSATTAYFSQSTVTGTTAVNAGNLYVPTSATAAPGTPVSAAGSPSCSAVTVTNAAGDVSTLITAFKILPAVGGNTWVQTSGAIGASPQWQAKSAWGTKTVTGLTASTSYSFTAFAAADTSGNCMSAASAASNSTTTTSANSSPGTPTLGAGSPSCTALTVTNNGSDSGTAFFSFKISPAVSGNTFIQANGSIGASAIWQTKATWATKTITGLASSTSYTVSVAAASDSSGGCATAYNAGATLSTGSATPSITSITPSTATCVTSTVNVSATVTGCNTITQANTLLLGKQLLTNPSFETGTMSGWTNPNTFAINGTFPNPGTAKDGTKWASLSSGFSGGVEVYQNLTVTANVQYYLSIWVYTDGSPTAVTASLQWKNGAISGAGQGTNVQQFTSNTTGWQQLSGFVTPTTTTLGFLFRAVAGGSAGVNIDLANVQAAIASGTANPSASWSTTDLADFAQGVDTIWARDTTAGTSATASTGSITASPTINTQPSNASVTLGATANFTVAATGTGLTYQWQVSTNGGSSFSNVSTGTGGTTTSYTTAATVCADNGNQYRCQVTACSTTINSNAATLTVTESVAPTITSPSISSCVASGGSITATATVTDNCSVPTSNLYLLAPNLLINPSFETGSVSGWTNPGVPNFGVDGTYAHPTGPEDGLHYGGTSQSGGSGTVTPELRQTVTVTAGQPYYLSVWFWNNSSPNVCSGFLQYFQGADPGSNGLGTNIASATSALPASWLQLQGFVTPMGSQLTIILKLSWNASGSGGAGYFDLAEMRRAYGTSSFVSGAASWTVPSAPTGAYSIYAQDPSGNIKVSYNFGTVNATPSAPTANNDGPVCVNGTLHLTASTVAGATYSWTGPNSFTSAAQNPILSGVTAAAQGQYSVTATVSGCTSSAGTTNVTIVSAPTASAGSYSPICETGSISLANATATDASSVSWSASPGGGSFAPSNAVQNPTYTPSAADIANGSVTLTLTAVNSPCSNATSQTTVNIVSNPTTATVGGPQTICPNGTTAGLGGNTPTVGTGTWSIVTGGFTGTFNPNNTTPNATFTQTSGGDGTCVLRWTISSTPCADSSADVSITIGDTIGPVITMNGGDQTISCVGSGANTYNDPGAAATDNCDASVTVTATYDPSFPDSRVQGVYLIHYDAVDLHGNPAIQVTRTVTIDEHSALSVTNVPADLPVECAGDDCGGGNTGVLATNESIAAFLAAAQASDICDDDVTISNDAPACFPLGTTTVTWTVTDTAHPTHTATAQSHVIVQDTSGPVVSGCPADITNSPTDAGQCTGTVTWTPPTASDTCSPPVQSSSDHEPGDSFPIGTTTVTYTFHDSASPANTSTCVFHVTVVDGEHPQITCPPDVTNVPADTGVCQATNVNIGTAGASDNCPGVNVGNDHASTTYPKGTTTVTWTATDAASNTAMCQQIVTVIDDQNPTITCPSDQTLIASGSSANVPDYTPQASAGDNCGPPTITQDPVAGSTVTVAGSPYTVTLTASDGSNTAQCTFQLEVLSSAPVASSSGPIAACYPTQAAAEAAALANSSATGGCSGGLTPHVNTTGACSADITVTFTDTCSNTSNELHYTTRIDGSGPVVTCDSDITVNADAGGMSASVSINSATALDDCDGSTSVSFVREDGHTSLSDPFDAGFAGLDGTGVTRITWSSTDSCSNAGQCVQRVTVNPLNEMLVSLQLAGVHAPSGGPAMTLKRCISFELYACPSSTPVTASAVLTFVSADASHDAAAVSASALIPAGSYSCVVMRDKLHTLRRSLGSLPASNHKYVADYMGGSLTLIGGNLNDDAYIDILDFGKYANQYNHTYTPPSGGSPGDTDCSTAAPNADISGNGTAFTEDFTFIQVNFLKTRDLSCCLAPSFASSGSRASSPVASISVADLKSQGMADLAIADVNGDGVVDIKDITAWMQGARPGQPLPPPPTRKR